MASKAPPVKNAIAMDTRNYSYSDNSAFQRLVYKEAERLFPDLSGWKNITVVDYGCGPGDNWTYGMKMLLAKADTDADVRLILNDSIGNNWNVVAQHVDNFRAAMGENRAPNIFMLPGSFYEQVMPPGSVDVGMAWSSFHFLENKPSNPYGVSEQEDYVKRRNRIREQVHASLIKLLRLRAREIKPGGHLIVALPTNASSNTPKLHYIATSQALKKCLDDGIMTEYQHRAFQPPIFEPNENDLREILSAVQDSWELATPWIYPSIPHPTWTKLQHSAKEARDYDAYAEGCAGFILAIYSGVLVSAVRCGQKQGEERPQKELSADEERFLIEFKTRCKEAVLRDELRDQPAKGYWLIMRLIRKARANI